MGTLVLSKFVELVEDVWYWGGGGGSLVGNPNGWTILIGLNLVLQELTDDTIGWLASHPGCTDEDCIVDLVGWVVCVIVTKLVLFPMLFEEFTILSSSGKNRVLFTSSMGQNIFIQSVLFILKKKLRTLGICWFWLA